MELNDKNDTPSNNDKEQFNLFEHLEVGYSKGKSAVWQELSQKIKADEPKVRIITLPRIAAAACILLVAGLGFMRFASSDIHCPKGEQMAHTLPDGSVIQLNADSKISYKPYWWWAQREVTLEGEAFFEVAKGKRFAVISALGTTEVLGTSFNILARDTRYEVFCATGKVKVTAQNEVTLTPNQYAVLQGKELTTGNTQKDQAADWLAQTFFFEKQPLQLVFEELERQYAIVIECKDEKIKLQPYSGNFNKPAQPEAALELICLSFNLTFSKKGTNRYLIE